MKICYHCFHNSEESAHFCTFCGASLDAGAEGVCPDAMPCGTTLYGRYLIGAVLRQDPASIIYIAQDSRTRETVAVKEYFPKQYAKRSAQRTVVVPEENRDAFLEGKDLFTDEAEKLSDEYDSEQPPRIQSYFRQNDTAYLVVDYGTPENLQALLDGKIFLTAGAQNAADHAHNYKPPVEQKKAAAFPAQNRDSGQAVPASDANAGESAGAAFAAGKSASNRKDDFAFPADAFDADIKNESAVPKGKIGAGAGAESAALAGKIGAGAGAESTSPAGKFGAGAGAESAAPAGKVGAGAGAESTSPAGKIGAGAGAEFTSPAGKTGAGAGAESAAPASNEKAGETSSAAPARPFPDLFAPSDISSAQRTSSPEPNAGTVGHSGASFPGYNAGTASTGPNAGTASTGPNAGPGRTVSRSAEPDEVIPKESIRYGSGNGGKKSSVVPFAIILAFLAACLIGIMLLVPRIFSGSQGSGRYVEFLFKRFIHGIQRETKKLEQITEQTQPFKGLFDDDDLTPGSDDPDNPDDPEDEIAESGISSSNFYNQGYYVLYEGECIYIDSTGIYRTDTDPDFENSEKITSGTYGYLNEYYGYIYYVNEIEGTIDCLDPDDDTIYTAYDCGTETSLAPESLYIYDDWGYFSHGSNLYRFNLEDTDINSPAGPEDTEKILNDFNANGDVYVSLCFVKGKLVYQGIYGITAVKPDGTDPNPISAQKGRLITDGESIYCFHAINNIFKIDLKGNTEQLPVEDKSQIITRFNCHGEWIYYTVQTQEQIELWKMKKDGADRQFVEIVGADNSSMISLCTFPDSGNAYYYMIIKQDDKLVTLHAAGPID